jgi:hypothetical protein
VKSFYRLDEITVDPRISLTFVDDTPVGLVEEEGEEDELHSLGELLAPSAKASELLELAATSKALCCREVRVLRVDAQEVEPGPIEPGVYQCLEEVGHHLCLLADPNPNDAPPTPSLKTQFAICITRMLVNQEPLCQLIGFLVAAREADLPDERPYAYMGWSSQAWKIGPLSTFSEAYEFAKHAADSCPAFSHVSGFVSHAARWLESEGVAQMTFSQLMEVVRQNDPFASWLGRTRRT